ncbi:MAG: VanW family protein [Lachnospiraceae bacterium]|nr:VanW family protein [Lachnospiraceae bacterium]
MRKQKSNKGNLILTGILSIIAFALVIVLCMQHGLFGGSGDSEPVSASTNEEKEKEPSNKGQENIQTGEGENLSEVSSEFKFTDGYTINGVDVSGKTLSEIKESVIEAESANPKDSVKITFILGEDRIEANTQALEFITDIDSTIEAAYKASKSGDGNNKEFKSSWSVSPDTVDAFVHATLDEYVKEPVEAYASGFDTENLTFIIEESENGFSINFDKTIADVKTSLNLGDYDTEIRVESEVVTPKNTAEFLRGYLCKVSSTTSTTTSSSNRNTNIRLVCEKLDGLVLQPGEQFDFNKYIGERTEAAGYKEAGGIFNGALRQELGGGICQANAMIYHSVTKADLQVDTRTPHTWPSDYVEVGTDATVSWGGPEFRFTNSSEYPIALHAYYGNQKVTVELYGRPLPDGMTIKLKGEIVSRTEAKVEYKADSDMALGEKVTEKSAHDAIKAKSYKIYYDADGNEIKREDYKDSSYPMINKVVRVGVRAEDGTIFKLNKETGETIAPEGYVPPTPTPDPDDPENIDDPDDEPEPTKKPKKPKKGEDEADPTSEPGGEEAGNSGDTNETDNSGDTGTSENTGETGDDEVVATPVDAPETGSEDGNDDPVPAG